MMTEPRRLSEQEIEEKLERSYQQQFRPNGGGWRTTRGIFESLKRLAQARGLSPADVPDRATVEALAAECRITPESVLKMWNCWRQEKRLGPLSQAPPNLKRREKQAKAPQATQAPPAAPEPAPGPKPEKKPKRPKSAPKPRPEKPAPVPVAPRPPAARLTTRLHQALLARGIDVTAPGTWVSAEVSAELAQELGKAPNTVQQALSRLRKELRGQG